VTIYDRDIATPHSRSIPVESIERGVSEGLTQREIAAQLGIAQSTVSKYFNRARLVMPGPAWGLGPAKLVEPAVKYGDELVVFLSDPHYPWQDNLMIRSALRIIQSLAPDRVVLNGDVNDFFALSRFNKGLDRLDTLQEELDEGNRFRATLRDFAGGAIIDETEGNHDSRIRTYVQTQARALVSLRNLKPENLLDWKVNEINPHGDNGFLLRPQFLVKHGSIARGTSGATAKAEYEAAGISGTSGHIHRFETFIRDGYVQREWHTSGCLSRLDPDYVKGGVPNWRQGLLVGTFSTKSDAFEIESAKRFGDGLLFGGQVY
jgi:hypothetical protein